jgi:hypothetical protein
MVKYKLRKSKKQYSYRKRHLGYTQRQRVEVKRMKLFMMQIAVLKVIKVSKTVPFVQALDAMFGYLYYQYLQIVLEPLYFVMPIVYLSRTIESFHEKEAYHLFRFNKGDLKRLMKALRIPEIVVTEERLKFSGEEIFLFFLNRLCSVTTLDGAAKTLFGREYTAWSKAFKWFLNHLHSTFLILT